MSRKSEEFKNLKKHYKNQMVSQANISNDVVRSSIHKLRLNHTTIGDTSNTNLEMGRIQLTREN